MTKSNDLIFKTKLIDSKLTHEIRKKVLWPHIKDGNYSMPVDTHPSTFHLGTFIKNRIISIGTFVQQNNEKFNIKKQYRLRAMATEENYRKKGGGKNLFLKGISVLKKKNIQLLWCDARLVAVPFYTSLNMKSLNEIYEIINIGPHKTMYTHI